MNTQVAYQKKVFCKVSINWDCRAVDTQSGKEGVLRMNALQKSKGRELARVEGICFPFTLDSTGSARYNLSQAFFYGSYQDLGYNYRRGIPSSLVLEEFKDRSYRQQGYQEDPEDRTVRNWFYSIPPAHGLTLERTLQLGSSQSALIQSLRQEAKSLIPLLGTRFETIKEDKSSQESISASFVDFPASLLSKAEKNKQFYKARRSSYPQRGNLQ